MKEKIRTHPLENVGSSEAFFTFWTWLLCCPVEALLDHLNITKAEMIRAFLWQTSYFLLKVIFES